MGLPKRVKEGGIYYKGYKIDVLSASGAYITAIVPSSTACAVVGLSITPGSAGLYDYFDVACMNTTGTVGGKVIKQIATNMWNLGGGITIGMDFAAMQLMGAGDSIRVSYINTASIAMPVYITVEAIK